MNIIGKETFVMKLMHKTFLNKGECQYDLTIENGQINENVHRGGGILNAVIANLPGRSKMSDSPRC